MAIVFSIPTARYRDTTTGQFIARATVLSFLEKSISESSDAIGLLTAAYIGKSLAKADFFQAFRQEVKEEHIRQYIAGRGGLPSMTQSDWGKLGSMIKEQYKYAAGFEKDIAGLSDAQITARAAMYAQAAGASHETGRLVAIKASGNFTEERWQLGDAEHCDDCESLASQGWVEIGTLGTFPKAGATQCLTNCKCEILYR